MALGIHEAATIRPLTKSLREKTEALSGIADPQTRSRGFSELSGEAKGHEEHLDRLGTRFPIQQLNTLARWLGRLGFTRPAKVIIRGLWSLCVLVIAVALVFAPGWPSVVFDMAGGGLSSLLLVRAAQRAGRLTLGDVWVPLLLLLVAAAISGGLKGDVPVTSHGEYRFRSDVAQDGAYARLGEAGGLTYLRRCLVGPTRLLAVRSGSVATVTLSGRGESIRRPSLWGVLFRGETVQLGYRGCR
jgi:hypothetical protein